MGLGVEYGCPFVLTGPDGSRAVFNDDSDEDFVGILTPEDSSGLDSPDVREDIQVHTEADGAVQGNNYYGARPVVLGGTIIASSKLDRNAKVAKLKAASNAMREDAVLTWAPPELEGEEVELKLRRQQPVRITKGYVKAFQIPMVAASSYIQSTDVVSGAAATLSSSKKKPDVGANNGGFTEGEGFWVIEGSPEALSAGMGREGPGETGNMLLFSDFDYALPEGAVVTKVKFTATIENVGVGMGSYNQGAYLMNGTTQVGTSEPSNVEVTGTHNITWTFEGDEQLKGLTDAIVNNTNFGLGIYVENTLTYSFYDVSVPEATVSYRVPNTVNLGDAPSYIAEAKIDIAGSDLVDLRIRNYTTGEALVFDYTFAKNQTVYVDFLNRNVTYLGANGNKYVDFAQSTWWGLEPGSNLVFAEAASGTILAESYKFRPAWL